jgi:amidase
MGLKRRGLSELLRALATTHEEVSVLTKFAKASLHNYDRLARTWSRSVKREQIRDRLGNIPPTKQNTYGAWAYICKIETKRKGKLHGKRVAIKDNIFVAGIPTINGSQLLQEFIPSSDATVVKRVISEGGSIVGKATCENLCVSGGSHTSYPGPVRNPHNGSYMAGGSSSGCAVLVANHQVDMAIGGDQGGSIRIPSSWCGIYGLKPTWGLVPYTGAIPLEWGLDHLGPMASSVRDLALLLEAISGKDGIDTRQISVPDFIPKYSERLKLNTHPRIAVITEGFCWKGVSEQDVETTVINCLERLAKSGAIVREISVPLHRDGTAIWSAIAMQGIWFTAVKDAYLLHYRQRMLEGKFVEFWSKIRIDKSKEFPLCMKLIAVLGQMIEKKYGCELFIKAQAMGESLKKSYDNVLEKFDILAMPTTPRKALPLQSMTLEDSLKASMDNLQNTCPFNVTGHPAINVPCGYSEGLPVGIMLVGRHFDELRLLDVALFVEHEIGTEMSKT